MKGTPDVNSLFKSIPNMMKAIKLRTDRNKQKAEKRLRPLYGDGWGVRYGRVFEGGGRYLSDV